MAKQQIQRIFMRMFLATIGLAFLILGLIYVTLGLVKASATIIPGWAAFIIVGAFLLGLGYMMARAATK